MEEKLPPGFRFHPTDEELITFYLTNKVSDFSFTARAIADVDLNKCEPWDLPGNYIFFCILLFDHLLLSFSSTTVNKQHRSSGGARRRKGVQLNSLRFVKRLLLCK